MGESPDSAVSENFFQEELHRKATARPRDSEPNRIKIYDEKFINYRNLQQFKEIVAICFFLFFLQINGFNEIHKFLHFNSVQEQFISV